MVFPGTVAWFWWLTRRIVWEDFEVKGGGNGGKEVWKKERERERMVGRVKLLGGAVALVGIFLYRGQIGEMVPGLLATLLEVRVLLLCVSYYSSK